MVWDMANLGFRQVKNSMFPYCQRPGRKIKSSLSIISLNYPLYMTALQIANSRVTLFQSEYIEHYSVSILSLSLTNLLPPWKILNKMKWRAEWDLNNLGRGYFQEKKKKEREDYFRWESKVLLFFSLMRFPNIQVFIYYSCSESPLWLEFSSLF